MRRAVTHHHLYFLISCCSHSSSNRRAKTAGDVSGIDNRVTHPTDVGQMPTSARKQRQRGHAPVTARTRCPRDATTAHVMSFIRRCHSCSSRTAGINSRPIGLVLMIGHHSCAATSSAANSTCRDDAQHFPSPSSAVP